MISSKTIHNIKTVAEQNLSRDFVNTFAILLVCSPFLTHP